MHSEKIKTKILIADDEKDVLTVMVKRVAGEGYEVVAAADGLEAWEKIQSESPDVILIDVNMPGMDGFEVLKKVREQPSAKWQPVIIVSAHGEMENIKKGYSLEADHYITKPCNIEAILSAIKIMVSLIPQRKPKIELESRSK